VEHAHRGFLKVGWFGLEDVRHEALRIAIDEREPREATVKANWGHGVNDYSGKGIVVAAAGDREFHGELQL